MDYPNQILSDSTQPHFTYPSHALTPYKDCDKLADGKQTKDFEVGLETVPPIESFKKEVYMKELLEVVMWSFVGVFTYILFVALNHTIWEVLK